MPRGVKVQVLSGLPLGLINMITKELKSTKLYKEYSLEIPYEEIDIEVDNKINQILPTVNIPGFRKGKAPLNICLLYTSDAADD